ncbi:delta(3,5)-Delta(2,4)-dienoyl-CoA isomerase, mitochondrial isoform X1 [Taeniopygia guttata]|uniref:delta(3,5)-Delta(2,4)-dienoyl-CoA isomerase, mitochondrial isoform X1 n=1 Tax=Taeniopygia guttata TaxID=59729 RepID=UPI003BB8DDA0
MAAALARLRRALRPSWPRVSRLGSMTSPMTSAAVQELQSLRLLQERPRVLHLQLHRPGKRNALDLRCWRELVQVFRDIAQDPECRAVVVSGAGAAFTAGIDLAELGSLLAALPAQDAARRAWALRRHILEFQESFSAMERCPKPVIAAVHGPCIGAGVDLISACDIRFCSQDAYFQVKEVDMGLAADVGTLQRLPKIVGSQSLVNELAFTARVMRAPEALSCGLVRPPGTWPCCRPRTSPSRCRRPWTRRDPRTSPSPSSDVTSVPPTSPSPSSDVTPVPPLPPRCHQRPLRQALMSPQCHQHPLRQALMSPQCHHCHLGVPQ